MIPAGGSDPSRAADRVQDGTILRVGGQPETLVAYVLPSAASGSTDPENRPLAALPEPGTPLARVPIASLPLTSAGEIDEAKLKRIPVIDSDLVRRWEETLRSRPEIDRVAVLVHDDADPPEHVHLDDLLPDGRPGPAGAAPEEASAPAGARAAARSPRPPALAHGPPPRDSPEDPKTLAAALERAARTPLAGAIVHHRAAGAPDDVQTFGELLLDAERILAGLRTRGLAPLSNVLLTLDRNQDILPAFWACVLGGFVPLIASAPPAGGDSQRALDQLRSLHGQLNRPFVLTAQSLGKDLRDWLTGLAGSPEGSGLVEELRRSPPDARHHVSRPDDLAFFTSTSGSTGMPKCVMLTHRGVLSRARGADALCASSPDDVVLNWLPFDHIGSLSDWHLRCVALRCLSVYVAKETILQQPLRWLDLIDRYRITHSWAPTFAYRLMAEALSHELATPWDLSCLKGLLSAGEHVSSEVETALLRRLGPCGLSGSALWTAFGMAETASGITYDRPVFRPSAEDPPRHLLVDRDSLGGEIEEVAAGHPNAAVFSSLGPPIPGMSLRIVDDGGAALPEHAIGRLQVKGEAVCLGFYQDPEATREAIGEDGWFDTGDRGFLSGGRLVLTGRDKDGIIVNGANYASPEIEAVVEEVHGSLVSFTAACAVRRRGRDAFELAVFFPARLGADTGLPNLLRAITRRVVQRLGFKPAYLVPLPKSDFAKTAIGKLRRQELKRRFEAGDFDRVLKEVDLALGNENTLPAWFFRPTWRLARGLHGESGPPPATVLVFAPPGGLGPAMKIRIEATGVSCVVVERGSGFERLEAGKYRIAAGDPGQALRLLDSVKADKGVVGEVLHLWNVGQGPGEVEAAADLERAQEPGIFSVLALAQALHQSQGPDQPVSLLVAQSGSEAVVSTDRVAAEKATLPGLVGSLAREMPWLRARHLDLPIEAIETSANRIMAERKVGATAEGRVAYRGEERFVLRIEKADLTRKPSGAPFFKPNGAYVICGAGAGLGPALAEYLRTAHAARVLCVDDNDRRDPRRLEDRIAEARTRWGTGLDGILSLSDPTPPARPLLEEDRAGLWARLQADLQAPWTLRRIAQGESDCALVLLSSPHDLLPAAGSGAQAMAASFHEGLSAPSPGGTAASVHSYRCAPWRSTTYGGPDAAGDPASDGGLHPLRVEQVLASCLAGLRRGEKNLIVGLEAGHRRVRRLTVNDDPALQRLTACYSANTLLDTAALSRLEVPDRFGTPTRCRFRQLREPAHAPPREIELWPSVAEHFVYDDLIYYALAHDERRNRSYRKAIDLLVKGKVVIDVGTGKEAILARICAEGGARKVYAVELGEAACRSAMEKVQELGLADIITVLHGDAQRIILPEPVDVCVSEVVGPIGGSEGAAPLLNGVRRLLKPNGVMIPSRSITRIAAVRLPDPLLDKPRFRLVPGAYALKIFAQVGYPFDLRVCIKNFPRSHVLSNAETFEDLDFTAAVETGFRRPVRLVVEQPGRLDGVLLWLNLHTMDGEVIDILEEEYVWLPVYFPLFSPGVDVEPGDVVEAICGGTLSDDGLHPDYFVEGRLTRRGGESLSFRHHSYHHRRVFEESPFYERLFAGARLLPDPKGPPETTTDFLAEMPLTEIGEVDRERLEAQVRPGKGEGRARTAPGSDVERRIAAIWQDLLKLAEVGLDLNFFELGGHSLLLVQAQGRLQEAFGPRVTLVELFKHPTVESLAAFLAQPASVSTPASDGLERARRRGARQGGPRRADIAVIGMACRFPGADDLAQFWRNLRGGVESITFFSPEEVAGSGICRASLDHPGYVRASAILSDVESFDAEFFEYTPHQARLMDPQHRLSLECAWECLESGGYDPFACEEIIGIYAGASMNTYLLNQVLPNRHRLDQNDDLLVTTLDSLGGFELMLANDKDYLTTRIAYKLNLRGPAITAQTACSTSLVTIHMACQSLIAGECDMALAGGVSVQVPQRAGHLYQDGIMVSPDGHCRAFDARAAGTVFGSGVGMVLLKPLEDAQRDGDFVWAVVKGSAVNNDGHRKLNYMAPSGDGQAAVLAQALGMSQVDASTISYVEAHGTGTILGDPIEIEGLSQVFRAVTDRPGFCAIGSVKTNVGHLQIASGIAGFIKTVLALHHEELPPSLHFEKPNPQIDFSGSPFFVNTDLRPWPRGEAPRRAGVNSLGIGGTNAHVILEEAPAVVPVARMSEPPFHLFTVSARSAKALRDLARRHLEHLSAGGAISLESLCHTVNVGRRHFRHRAAATAGSVADVVAALGVLASGEGSADNLVRGEAPRKERPRLAFTCLEEGAERAGMGRQLYETLPVFRQAIDRCGEALRPLLETPLGEVLYPESRGESRIARADEGHAALFAVEVALCEVWRSCGIVPALLHGRGVGEYVAAWAADILDLEDAMLLVVERARALEGGAGSADSTSLAKRRRGMVFRPPRLEVVPGAQGASAADMARPDYWAHRLASPASPFSSGPSELPLPGVSLSLEIGQVAGESPRPPASATDSAPTVLRLASLARGGDDWPCLLASLGVLYTRGLDVDWKGLLRGRSPRRLELPTYPFQRQRYWMDVAPERSNGA